MTLDCLMNAEQIKQRVAQSKRMISYRGVGERG